MGGEILNVGQLKQQTNFIPLPYRRVSFQPYDGAMTEIAITRYLLAREIYRRTDVVIFHNSKNDYAVTAVQRRSSESLFTRLDKVEVLALPEDCVFIQDNDTDPANRSALAELALRHKVTSKQTAIVLGAFDHVNIIHHPDPLRLRVVEVVPPKPPKLYAMVKQVLGYADLPPISVKLEAIDLAEISTFVKPEAFLVPCRSGGLDKLSAPVYFLDERPMQRENWTLLGCERSLQFHRHYYGDEPPRVEMCPRKVVSPSVLPTLLKCCLLEFDTEFDERLAVVPWGADLNMVESALRHLSQQVDYV